jgi:hypothetical protein
MRQPSDDRPIGHHFLPERADEGSTRVESLAGHRDDA